jgi:stage II sporulation protein AA (anti-sigma F factor antagonist)
MQKNKGENKMQRDVLFSEKEDELIARIGCDIDHHSAKPMREKIDNKLFETKPRMLTIDFSAVGFMDSSGLGLILGRVEKASTLGISVRLTGLSPTLMKLVRLAGIERVKNLTVTR